MASELRVNTLKDANGNNSVATSFVAGGSAKAWINYKGTSTNAIMDLAINSKKPIGNAILTCLNMKQEKARKKKGAEAAKAVVSVLSQK